MTRFYGIDEANEALPDVERILLDLRDQRAELIRLRDAVLAASRGSRRTGSARAYRPPPEAARRAAFASALEAYERGDFFLAHEILEPAWMGASDPAERALHSGLIKVAAAFVHAVRGNAAGVTRNLEGARTRLRNGRAAGPVFEIDVAGILGQVEDSLA